MQTRWKYLANLYNQSVLSENVFLLLLLTSLICLHLNGAETRILQVFGTNHNLEKTSTLLLSNEVPHKCGPHSFF